MTTVEARHGRRVSFWEGLTRKKNIDLLTGVPGGIPYRIVLKNEAGRILAFSRRLLPYEFDNMRKVMLQLLDERSRKLGVNLFVHDWYVTRLVETTDSDMEEEEEYSNPYPSGVVPL